MDYLAYSFLYLANITPQCVIKDVCVCAGTVAFVVASAYVTFKVQSYFDPR